MTSSPPLHATSSPTAIRHRTAPNPSSRPRYLKLVHRYLSQARELEKIAGDDKIIQVETCESPVVGELLRVLGFRIRGGCGSEVVLETVNASRAFLTTDSGFPIHQLEEALPHQQPLHLRFPSRHRARPLLRRLLDERHQGQGRRLHRNFHLRSLRLPPLSRHGETRSQHRRRSSQGHLLHAPQSLRARARFLWRHVRNPRRQSRPARRPPFRSWLGRPRRRLSR